jgi:biotin carboxyl carrier protein
VHPHIQRQQQLAKSIVSSGGVVMNKIAGDQRAVRAPVTGVVVVQNQLQRLLCDGASEVAVCVGKQVRVGQVQYPNRLLVICVSGRLNKLIP